MHAGPILTRDVRAATALINASDSTRGLAPSESPTQTSDSPLASADSARVRRSSAESSAITTFRFDKTSPNRALMLFPSRCRNDSAWYRSDPERLLAQRAIGQRW